MVATAWALSAICCASHVLATPHPLERRAPAYKGHPERAAGVVEAFNRAWSGYYQFAFPNDSLKPISKTFENDRNGWGASAIDALSTALVMKDAKVISQIVDFIPTINFDKTNNDTVSVSLFETTIRYLGGLLSAHDLLTGPLKEFAPKDVDRILDQAEHLADVLKFAFDTPSGVPFNDINLNPSRPSPDSTGGKQRTNGLATVGTLVLEWTRLSDKTGNPEYGRLAQKAESYLLEPKPQEIGEPYPGLLGSSINISNGHFVNSAGGWNGGTDSFYEYLIKMYMYDSDRFPTYKDRWIAAVESSITYLTSHPTTRPDVTFLAAYRGRNNLTFVSQHLACFDGGNFILGGLTLDEPKYVEYGLELVRGCHETYIETATGIGPEVFRWQDNATPLNASNNRAPPTSYQEFYEKAGFWIDSAAYVLRPEVIESYYYAYRATGDAKYQDWAWDAFRRINESCSAGVGFSAISDVNQLGGGEKLDDQESFWFAEVLKYSYLIQSDQDTEWQVSADHRNLWVFNTEAHPMKIAGSPR